MNATHATRPRAADLARRVTVVVAVLALAFALKAYYRDADFDGLRWVLAPTAGAVGVLTGTRFELEPHRAYLARAHRYEIVPACAGVNFMIAALVTVAVAVAAAPRCPGAVATVALAAATAYGCAIVANATRIAVAMRLHEAQATWGPLTPARLHRLAGVVVYFGFLCVTYLAARHAVDRGHAHAE